MKYQIGDIISIHYENNDHYLYFGVIIKINRYIYVNRVALKYINSRKIIKMNNILVFNESITSFNINTLDKGSNLYKLLKLESTKYKLKES